MCLFLSSVVGVENSGCSLRSVVWAVGVWRLIRVMAAVASRSSSLIDFYPSPFDMPFVVCSRFQMSLIM